MITTIEGHKIEIGKRGTPNAGRFRILNSPVPHNVAIPLDIAKLGAGKDAWMRQIPVECECGTTFKLCDSDSSECCQTCFDAAGEENARIDAGE